MKRKIIQVPVVIGKGEGQFFVENEVQISPPCPPIYKIEKIDRWVDVYSYSVIPGKVIFNAYLWKNVLYKTVEDVCDQGVVNGPVYHATFKTPFGGFVEIDPIGCEKITEKDVAELLEAYVEGEKTYLLCEDTLKCQKVYKKLLEKDVVKLVFKVTRTEHTPVPCDFGEGKKDEGKCDKKYDEKWDKHDDKDDDKCEWDWEKRRDCRGDFYANYRGEKFYQKR